MRSATTHQSIHARRRRPRSARDSSTAPSSCRRLHDGARVRVDATSVEIRDEQNRLLLRYADGHAEIEAPSGDLCLRAPQGAVRVEAAAGITLCTPGLLRQQSERVEVDCETLSAHATRSELSGDRATIVMNTISTAATWMSQKVDHYELEANRLVERTRDSLRHASELWQVRAKAMRQLVDRSYSLRAERATIVSKKETSIDGSKVLLG